MPARVRAAALLVALLLVAGTGCGGAPQTIGATGVDGLEVPTASPDPGDFVTEVDNPWLPLAPGTERRYDAGDAGRLRVTVAPETVRVAGIDATEVESVLLGPDGRAIREETGWYAQDRDGNVWLLGRRTPDGGWRTGQDGALAGLAQPAVPRRGDGYVDGRDPGDPAVGDRLEVVEVDADPPSGLPDGGPLLLVERRSGEDLVAEYYRRGTGLVATDPLAGDGLTLRLSG